MNLKICGLKYQSNIEELISLKIDYVCFIFYKKSSRYIDESISFDFIRQIPKHISKVGVFVNETTYSILNAVAHYNLDVVQLHGDESEKMCEELKPYTKVIKAFRIHDRFDFTTLKNYLPHVNFFLFDTDTKTYGGSGQQFNWELLKQYMFDTPFFLSGGIDPSSIKQLQQFNHPQLHAIDINSKFEQSPALKDIEKIKQFIQNINTNDNN
jgi:phosphoribosylanthranilate isomerase